MKLRWRFVLAPIFVVAGAQQASAQSLTVALYQGQFGEAIRGCIVEPFARATNVKVTPELGMSVDTLEKLRRQRNNPVIDVAWLDGGVSELAAEDGLVAPISRSAAPGIADMVPEGVHRTASGAAYALSTGFVGFGLVYNSRDAGPPPDSWWDIWKPEFAGRTTVPGLTHPMGVALLLQLNNLLGGVPADLAPAGRMYAKLQGASFPDTLAGSVDDFRGGKASVGAQYAAIAWSLADSGLPIDYAAPKEGALASDIRVHIVKGSRNLALARRFVNFAVATEQASCMSEKVYLGPATRGVTLSERAQARMPWGKNGTIRNLVMIDWDRVHRGQKDAAVAWQRDIGRTP